MSSKEELIEEIRQIKEQCEIEMMTARPTWPRSKKSRVLELTRREVGTAKTTRQQEFLDVLWSSGNEKQWRKALHRVVPWVGQERSWR